MPFDVLGCTRYTDAFNGFIILPEKSWVPAVCIEMSVDYCNYFSSGRKSQGARVIKSC